MYCNSNIRVLFDIEVPRIFVPNKLSLMVYLSGNVAVQYSPSHTLLSKVYQLTLTDNLCMSAP